MAANKSEKVIDQLGKTLIHKAKRMREEKEGSSPEQLMAVAQFTNAYRKLLEQRQKALEAEDPYLNGLPTD